MENKEKRGRVFFCPTPIGNLEDISLRSLRVLKEADVILCEDTRHSAPLLKHFQIKKPLLSYHKYNEESRMEEIIEKVQMGKNIAVISDAGMPGVSDPGELLIQRLLKEGLEYEVLPGACAHVTASVAANLPQGRYLFWGFLPSKNGPREKILAQVGSLAFPVLFYEGPHRIEKTIESIDKTLGNRQIILARELTKIYEEVLFTNTQEFLQDPSQFTLKGEFVLILMPKEQEKEEINIREELEKKIGEGMKKSQAVKEVARENNLGKNQVYKESLDII